MAREQTRWRWAAAILVFAAARACAAVDDVAPIAAAVRLLSTSLTRIEASRFELTKGEERELKEVAKDCRASLVILRRQIGKRDVAPDYLEDLSAGGLVLRRILAKSIVTAADLARLRTVARDIDAKRRWAERNAMDPMGRVAVALVAPAPSGADAGTRSVKREVVLRNAVDETCELAAPTALDAGTGQIALRPGYFSIWVRRVGTHPVLRENTATFFAVDAPTRVELGVR